ncbi:MAG: chemotaxis protein CheB [Burkholderiales bacterium]
MRRNLVVVGASAGGIDALRRVVAGLPADFPAALCAVIHVSHDAPGILDRILQRAGSLPAVMVKDEERLRDGVIYVPRPDHHLIVEPARLCATRGPKENRFRPAVDPLFRSAAQTYGPQVIGVILTGALDDGTAGLWTVKQLGGVAVVQDPDDAEARSMPQSACEHVRVDYCVPLRRIASLLVELATQDIAEAGGYSVPESINIEVEIAKENAALELGIEALGVPSRYACPECHGVLLQLKEGDRVRFRCHTGHAYSAEALVAGMDPAIEESLWSSIRALQEKILLVRHLEGHARAQQDERGAEVLGQLAEHAQRRADLLRRAVWQAEVAPADDVVPRYGAPKAPGSQGRADA